MSNKFWDAQKLEACKEILREHMTVSEAARRIRDVFYERYGEDAAGRVTSRSVASAFFREDENAASYYLKEGEGDALESENTTAEDMIPDDPVGFRVGDTVTYLPPGDDQEYGMYVAALSGYDHLIYVDEKTHQEMREDYSNVFGVTDHMTINEILRKYGWRRKDFMEYKQACGWTHDMGPHSSEELQRAARDDDKKRELKAALDQIVEGEMESHAREQALKRNKKDARKWRRFKNGHLDPFEKWLGEHQPRTRDQLDPITGQSEDFAVLACPTDLHYGAYPADAMETNEDLREFLFESTENLQAWILDHGRPEQIILPVGSDWVHLDNARGETTSHKHTVGYQGHPDQLRWEAADLFVELVDRWRKIAPVKLPLMRGNHDSETNLMMLWGLNRLYEDVEDVEVRMRWEYHQFVQYGDNMLMVHHGKWLKDRDLSDIMANQRPKMWGDTQYRYAVGGHKHQTKEHEDGVHIIFAPALASTTRFLEKQGYLKHNRAQAAYLFGKDDGRYEKKTQIVGPQ